MAREILEIEGTTVNVGSVENGGVVVKNGQIGVGSDTRDLYQIDITRPTQLTTLLVPKSANANLRIFDSNGNKLAESLRGGTANDATFNPNLPKGTYIVEVSGFAGSATNYDLSIVGAAVTNAQMSVTVDRIRAIDSFDFFPGDKSDFYINDITISGQSTGRSRVFWDQTDVRPNYTVARNVDINNSMSTVGIAVKDDDPPFPRILHDVADIGEGGPGTIASGSHRSTYDARSNQMVRDSGTRLSNGATITSTGDGFGFDFNNASRLKRASIEYRATYSAFTSSSTFNQLNRSTTTKGDNRSNTIVGNNRNGILDGGRGADDLSGMGGNDALIGNFGNDTLRAGAGRDIAWGSQGNDTYYGGAGRDTFVLDLLRGVDVIKDYKDGVDKIGLTNGIVYELLDIRREGRNSGIFLGDQKLGVVENTRPRDLTADDFKSISFVTIKDIVTPQVMA